jgi:hypothetical protein
MHENKSPGHPQPPKLYQLKKIIRALPKHKEVMSEFPKNGTESSLNKMLIKNPFIKANS